MTPTLEKEKGTCLYLFDIEAALADESRNVTGHVAAFECPPKERFRSLLPTCTGGSGDKPCSKKMSLPPTLSNRRTPLIASTTPGIVHNVKVVRTVSTPASTRAVKPGGNVIVSTFGPEGPSKCSGLGIVRYDADSLHQEFGVHFGCWIAAKRCTANRLEQSSSFFTVCAGLNESAESHARE
jgi:hypothetical protein